MHFSADTGCNRKYDSELSQHTNTQKAIMTSKMVISQPQPVMDARDSDEWGSGICDCFQNVPELSLSPPVGHVWFCPSATMSMRVSMRQRYGIKDTMCRDCLFATFCSSCSWCQMSREMRRRNLQVVLVSAKNT
ncbi:hypothetical protein F7725_007012 [Dissostichus mawsoni]|uniref:Plac8 onzin related protein 2 n=1 Tax=Dissostichus mawsoni TaxID=36200 RepID=A0A7J5XVJ2_DISMA|nr:hypothetical protein F7725_007012 [Dissostichus mawsoni]